ncbi:MAG: phosphoribosylaminoimidazolesuccinocarboxamide synthase [Candidatus Altiarchaeota archaeon]|nr:phosphoribosylaminoimidazolesuccinocarboxamide synthase [Candidatus Altiarchaeota archaeon]
MEEITKTDLPLKLHGRGKVRDIYDLGDKILLIATDRISAFDSILPNGIPHKGEVLNKISAFWFENTKDIITNHMITTDVNKYPEELKKHKDILEGRSMLVKKTQPLPIECVARGYLAGSGWTEYQQKQSVCGIQLPKGLVESDKLPETIFTPATKAESGHDINISFEETTEIVGEETAEKLRNTTIQLYEKADKHAESRGIIICDTKFEFGILNDEVILIDEALTPDSSRFWPKKTYRPGGPQKSYDKQYVRDYLLEIKWNKEPPAPQLPEKVIQETSKKYIEAYEQLTGKKL